MLYFKRIFLVLFSVLIWTFFVLSCIVMFAVALLVWLLTVLFDRRLFLLHAFSSFWGSLYIWLNPLWVVRIRGRRHIRPGTSYVMVSNHQSMLDILVLYQIFRHFKFVSKVENFSIPVIGWLMRLNRYPGIIRGDKESALKLFARVSELLDRGSPILMFPEGTRHEGDKLGPFREGAFKMALENKVPVLPIVMEGTARALPKKGIVLAGRTRINVHILEEIDVAPFQGKKPADLMHHTRRIMKEEFDRMTDRNLTLWGDNDVTLER